MAKVLVVSKKLNPTCFRLAQTLRSQQHEVSILTSQKEDGSFPAGIECMTPFEKWSAVEALRWIPALLQRQPNIVHFLLEGSADLSMAHVILIGFIKSLPNTVISTSLLSNPMHLGFFNPMRLLLQESDIITCPSYESLATLRGLNVRSHQQSRGILPPALDLNPAVTEEESIEVNGGPQQHLYNGPYVVMPLIETVFAPNKSFFDRLSLLASHRHVMLIGSMDSWTLRERRRFQKWMEDQGLGHRWTLVNQKAELRPKRLLQNAEALVLAGCRLTPFELADYFYQSIQTECTLVLDDRQAGFYADLWRHGENCWIIPSSEIQRRLNRLMNQGSLRLQFKLPQHMDVHRNLIDLPINELNRLYSRALFLRNVTTA
jgi:hypothetical protein